MSVIKRGMKISPILLGIMIGFDNQSYKKSVWFPPVFAVRPNAALAFWAARREPVIAAFALGKRC
ncbi:MAG TPA: hypothetical protein IAD19_02020 [Candidatus Egerieicola faecale]|uniref:Uncharacterized protein n=1 Tax=Candidatus Egerieicola faecale TaxID=2840774 RepID=A0A9D1IR91_9FIRM|nr:hypothetical protein [Candidatus Egerieicola faecale]